MPRSDVAAASLCCGVWLDEGSVVANVFENGFAGAPGAVAAGPMLPEFLRVFWISSSSSVLSPPSELLPNGSSCGLPLFSGDSVRMGGGGEPLCCPLDKRRTRGLFGGGLDACGGERGGDVMRTFFVLVAEDRGISGALSFPKCSTRRKRAVYPHPKQVCAGGRLLSGGEGLWLVLLKRAVG